MRAPVSWLRELVEVLPGATGADIAASLVAVGLEEEGVYGGDVAGPIVVGRVLRYVDEPQKNGKVIRWCQVDVGAHGQRLTEGTPQEIVCGAHNFTADDLVVAVLPGASLPGGFEIGARRTYGHVSHGMICSEDELGLGEDHTGIVVLGDYLADDPKRLARAVPGSDAIDLLRLDEEVIEVNVTPDRGYCLSMRGIAREYAHATGARFVDPVDELRAAAPEDDGTGHEVRLEDATPIDARPGCDRYVARIVRGVDVDAASPPWLARRLTQLGMRSISLVVDVTNYVMLLLGQPLHAFDLDALAGPIVVRRARPGERLTTLDDVERELATDDLLITDGARPLAIAGVMGGADCEVGPSTTNVLIESAHFDSVTVARSSRRHRLATEASRRYERGVDTDLAAAAAELAVRLLVQHGGGSADEGVTVVGDPSPPVPVNVDPGLPARIIGVDFGREEVIGRIREIGATVEDRGTWLRVTPPTWRPDLATGEDFAEEVARLRGYDAIPSVLPQAPGGSGLTRAQRHRRLLADTLAQHGLVEVLTSPFVAADLTDRAGIPTDDPRRRAVRLANPLNANEPLFRTSVLSTLLAALRLNVARGRRDVALFEIGIVAFARDDARAPVPPLGQRPTEEVLDAIGAALPEQPRHLAFALAGDREPMGPWGPARPADAGDAIALARVLGAALGLDLTVRQTEHAPWHPGRCAELGLADGTVIGHAGELHPTVLADLELPRRTCAGELDVDALSQAAAGVTQAVKLSTYPPARTDVALAVEETVPAGVVEAALRRGAGASLESLDLFDIYRGGPLADGHKSLAYRLTFRSTDRTLTTAEVSALRDAAVTAASSQTGARLRGS